MSRTMNKFLFELGTEEIPAGMIADGLNRLVAGVRQSLEEARVAFDGIHGYSSPRRLSVVVDGLPERQPDREEITQGPPRRVAFDEDGNPTQAAHGFARKMSLEVDRLEVQETERGDYVVARRVRPGRPVKRLLGDALPGVIQSISWPKTMYWRETKFRFIRPLRWFVALWNAEILSFEFEGLRSDRYTRGHRFLGNTGCPVVEVDRYVSTLREQYVLVDLEERREKIARELKSCTPDGLHALEDAQLEELVLYLNEYPSVLLGSFEERFLEIPQQVLITVMRHHQKYFAVVDGRGRLQPWFLTVLNTAADTRGKIRKGHERVLKARLEDAAFFWESDRRRPLEDRVPELADVVFQKNLGSYFEKTERIRALCSQFSDDPALDQAARLCKADLTTEMVFEMPELQGIMGGLYAREEGKPEKIWKSIYEHYQPVSLEDSVPGSRLGALLSLADRLDTIVGCFALGIRPTSSSDPLGLRRQAQGAVKILLEHRLDLALSELVELAARGFGDVKATDCEEALEFLRRRLHFILQEQGFSYDVLNAVFKVGADRAADTRRRARALAEIRSEPDLEALAVAFKRIRNILTGELDELPPLRPELLEEESEIALHQAYLSVAGPVEEALQAGDFGAALRTLATLRTPVDRFFDDVMVLVEDADLRRNRLRLLTDLSELFLRIADISEIVRND